MTGGGTSGQVSIPLTGFARGDYVARAFFNNSYSVVATSAVFRVGDPVIRSDKTQYVAGEPVVATFGEGAGNGFDWIAVAAPGSPGTQFQQSITVGPATSGTRTFNNVPTGTWVLRFFFDNSYVIAAESTQFTVSAGPSVTPSQSTYAANQAVIVSFANMSGSATDWIALTTPGAGPTTFVDWRYTGGSAGGSVSFGVVAPGTYVARAYFNNEYTVRAESSAFVVSPPSPDGGVADGGDAAPDAPACLATPAVNPTSPGTGTPLPFGSFGCDPAEPPVAYPFQVTQTTQFTMWINHTLSPTLKQTQIRNGCDMSSTLIQQAVQAAPRP
jgi:hypothetical protein